MLGDRKSLTAILNERESQSSAKAADYERWYSSLPSYLEPGGGSLSSQEINTPTNTTAGQASRFTAPGNSAFTRFSSPKPVSPLRSLTDRNDEDRGKRSPRGNSETRSPLLGRDHGGSPQSMITSPLRRRGSTALTSPPRIDRGAILPSIAAPNLPSEQFAANVANTSPPSGFEDIGALEAQLTQKIAAFAARASQMPRTASAGLVRQLHAMLNRLQYQVQFFGSVLLDIDVSDPNANFPVALAPSERAQFVSLTMQLQSAAETEKRLRDDLDSARKELERSTRNTTRASHLQAQDRQEMMNTVARLEFELDAHKRELKESAVSIADLEESLRSKDLKVRELNQKLQETYRHLTPISASQGMEFDVVVPRSGSPNGIKVIANTPGGGVLQVKRPASPADGRVPAAMLMDFNQQWEEQLTSLGRKLQQLESRTDRHDSLRHITERQARLEDRIEALRNSLHDALRLNDGVEDPTLTQMRGTLIASEYKNQSQQVANDILAEKLRLSESHNKQLRAIMDTRNIPVPPPPLPEESWKSPHIVDPLRDLFPSSQLGREAESMRRALHTGKGEKARLNEQLDGMREQLLDVQRQIDSKTQEIETTKNQLHNAEQRLRSLETVDLDTQRRSTRELTDMQHRLSSSAVDSAKREGDLLNIIAEKDRQIRQRDEQKFALQEQIKDSIGQLHNKDSQILSLMSDHEQMRVSVRTLQGEVDSKQALLLQQDKSLKDQAERLQKSMEELRSARQQQDSALSENHSLRVELSDLKNRLERNGLEVEHMKEQYQRMVGELNSHKNLLNQHRKSPQIHEERVEPKQDDVYQFVFTPPPAAVGSTSHTELATPTGATVSPVSPLAMRLLPASQRDGNIGVTSKDDGVAYKIPGAHNISISASQPDLNGAPSAVHMQAMSPSGELTTISISNPKLNGETHVRLGVTPSPPPRSPSPVIYPPRGMDTKDDRPRSPSEQRVATLWPSGLSSQQLLEMQEAENVWLRSELLKAKERIEHQQRPLFSHPSYPSDLDSLQARVLSTLAKGNDVGQRKRFNTEVGKNHPTPPYSPL